MPYTVKQLATLSGVSVRTLHYYDEIELLKPAYVGDNQYRYYTDVELLRLQQILLYRELNVPLDEIPSIIDAEAFDQLDALESHRKTLLAKREHYHTLLNNIDKTIMYLKGDTTVKLEEIFDGFSEDKQIHYQEFLINKGVKSEVLEGWKQRTQHWTKEDWLAHKQRMDDINVALCELIEAGFAEESTAVQTVIEKHHQEVSRFWDPDKNGYLGLADLYSSHPDFEQFYNEQHPQLLKFIQHAMRHYAEKHLS